MLQRTGEKTRRSGVATARVSCFGNQLSNQWRETVTKNNTKLRTEVGNNEMREASTVGLKQAPGSEKAYAQKWHQTNGQRRK